MTVVAIDDDDYGTAPFEGPFLFTESGRMKDSLLNRIPLDPAFSPGRVELLRESVPDIQSQALDWPGVLIEAGRNQIASVENFALAHHYVGMNTSSEPVPLYAVSEGGASRDVVLAPGDMWIAPARQPVSLHVKMVNPYVRLTIDPRYLGGPDWTNAKGVELRRAYGVQSPQLRHLIMALLAEADARNPGGILFVESLAVAIGHQLVRHAGTDAPEKEVHRGGLSSRARRRVVELIESNLGSRLSINDLAREVSLSPTHFAHAFKSSLGAPPHQYVMRLRLERARRMLDEPGARLSDVAQRSGFADQAHFTRQFKRHFGVTPGHILKARR